MASPILAGLEADDQASRACWAAVAGFAAATGLAYAAAGLSLDVLGGWRIWLTIAGLAVIAWIYRRRGPLPRLSHGADAMAQLISILLLGMLLSFALAVLGASIPYRDDWLAAADARLGFDWPALNAAVMARPWLVLVLVLSYVTMVPQLAVVVIVLAATGRLRRLQHLVLSVAICLAATLAIFPLMPALGYHAHLGLPDAPPFVALLEAIRSGAIGTVRMDKLDGLVSFPSFHTAAALLSAWAFWDLRWLRWPAVAVNLLIVASTPIMGSHYLVDLLAGAVAAVAAIAMAGRLLDRRARARSRGEDGRVSRPA